jgi:hypothetical protein
VIFNAFLEFISLLLAYQRLNDKIFSKSCRLAVALRQGCAPVPVVLRLSIGIPFADEGHMT